jgi:hypothetical protein
MCHVNGFGSRLEMPGMTLPPGWKVTGQGDVCPDDSSFPHKEVKEA